MIETPYQLIDDLKCDEIKILLKKGNLKYLKLNKKIENKCGVI